MTWSYTGPTSSNSDMVRFLIGDTKEGDQSLQDEELVFLLSQEDDSEQGIYYAAANAAESMAAKYLKLSVTSKTVGPLSIDYNNAPVVADRLYKLATRLRQGRFSVGSQPQPWMGDDSPSIFYVGMNDNGFTRESGWDVG